MLIDELRARWNQALSYRGRCPKCDSDRVWHNGIRHRTASVLDGDQTIFIAEVPVRRLRCGDCSARWSHLPERVTSRSHYQPCVVASGVARSVLDHHDQDGVQPIERGHGADRRTVRRWIERVADIADPAQLARALVLESAAPVLPALPAPRPSRSLRLRALGQRAVGVLALLEALASLRGLEPPGLAHARRLVPADAATASSQGGAPFGA